jgi:hypothetical protein
MAAAVRADGNLGVGELLDLFCVLVAGGAFVFVERHDFFLAVVFPVYGSGLRSNDNDKGADKDEKQTPFG